MSSSPLFRINTKGTCLLCLHHPHSSSNSDRGSDRTSSSCNDAAFKMLLRYLKVDLKKLVHFSSSVLSSSSPDCSLDSWNFSVTLCDDCSSVATDFHELLQAYEGIRIQLDLCIGQLHEFMEEGDKDLNRVLEYEKRMNIRKVEDLLAASIAENLRKETMEKASRNVKCSLPRISLKDWNKSRMNIKEQKKPPENDNTLAHFPSENTDDKPADTFSDEGEAGEVDALKENQLLFCTEDESMDMDHMDRRSIEVEVEDVAVPLNSIPAFVNKNDNEVETPKLSEHEEQVLNLAEKKDSVQHENTRPWTCEYCLKRFARKCAVKTHQLQNHTMTALCDRLPPSVSYQHLNDALKRIYTSTKIIIPLCKKGYVRYACSWCTPRLQLKSSSLKTHLLEFHLDKVIQEMEKHEKPLSSRRKIYSSQRQKCTYCGISCSQRSHLRRHQYIKHATSFLSDEGRLPPSISEQQLDNALAVILVGTSGKGAKCPLCGFKSDTCHLKAHVLHRHLDNVLDKVKVGGSGSETSVVVVTNNLKQSPQPSSEEMKQPLPLLPVFNGRKQRKKVSKYMRRPCKCKYCGVGFAGENPLKRHQYSKHAYSFLLDEDLLPPDLSEQQLETALASVLNGASGRGTKCPLCGKGGSFQNTYHIRAHILKHHLPHVIKRIGEKDCHTNSDNTVKENNDLVKTQRSQQRPPPRSVLSNSVTKYKCNFCGKILHSSRRLKDHYTRLHLGQRNTFKCDHCPKWFTAKTSLRTHRIYCHPVAVFAHRLPAGVTDRDFDQAVTIIVGEQNKEIAVGKQGRRLHGTNEWYECTLCGQRGKDFLLLRSHIARTHLDEVIRILRNPASESR